jgi:hypothetical protein
VIERLKQQGITGSAWCTILATDITISRTSRQSGIASGPMWWR